jgi:hypothetical protein
MIRKRARKQLWHSLPQAILHNRRRCWKVLCAMQQLAKNEAVNTLEAIRSYEFGTGPRSLGCAPAFGRGSAYLKLHDGARAETEFQRILHHRGAASWSIEGRQSCGVFASQQRSFAIQLLPRIRRNSLAV